MNKKYVSLAVGLVTAASLAAALPASAQTMGGDQGGGPGFQGAQGGGFQENGNQGGQMREAMKPAVFGTVASVSGDTLTVTGRGGSGRERPSATSTPSAAPAAVTYTVDATNATVFKDNATSSISAIAVGDTVMAEGTLTGTNLAATSVRDGVKEMRRGGDENGAPEGGWASTTPAFTGNGEPVTAGAVTAISGSTITITNKSNVTYTIDASSARIVSGQNSAATIANVAVGDSIMVQGTVSGTSVTATTVIDQAKPADAPSDADASSTPKRGMMRDFFGGIGSFFGHLFGF